MTREKLIETMARTLCDVWGYNWTEEGPHECVAADGMGDEAPGKDLFRAGVAAILAAIEKSGLAVVPVVSTDHMDIEGIAAYKENQYANSWEIVEAVYTAMIAASPLAKEGK